MAKIKGIKFIWFLGIFFYISLFGLLLQNSFSYFDPDFGWHLKVGQGISQEMSVPHDNLYNYTFTGDWVDHEWLSNFLIYQVYSNFGYITLSFLFALIIIMVLLIMVFFSRTACRQSPVLLLALLQLVGLAACLPHFGVRIQELALLFLLVLLIGLYYYNKSKNLCWLVFFPIWLYLWANLHASFLIGFFLLFAFIVIKALEKWVWSSRRFDWLDFSQLLGYKEIGWLALSAILALLSAFFTPYRAELFSFLGGYGNTVYFSYIQEWLSQFSFPFLYRQLFYLAIVFLAILVYLYEIYRRRQKLNIWKLFVVGLFFLLGFKSRRHFPLLFVSSFAFLVEVYGPYFCLRSLPKQKSAVWLNIYLSAALIILAFSQFFQTRWTPDPFAGFCRDYPCGAVQFLKSKPGAGNIFNNYGWGGYLIAVWPEKKLFIDGRLPQVKFAEHTFLEEYLSFYRSDDCSKKLAEYNIDTVLLPTKTVISRPRAWEKFIFMMKDEEFNNTNPLRDCLFSASDWQRVYYDPVATVFMKRK